MSAVMDGFASKPRSFFQAGSTGGKSKGSASNAIGNSGSLGVVPGILQCKHAPQMRSLRFNSRLEGSEQEDS